MIEDVRDRLKGLLEEYVALDAELRKLEDTEFRVCIFGSARIRPEDPTYQVIYRLAKSLSGLGVDIVTGGGPGLMEAANRGVPACRSSCRGASKPRTSIWISRASTSGSPHGWTSSCASPTPSSWRPEASARCWR